MSGDAHDFNNIETQAVIKSFFLQGKASKIIHAILAGTLACFLPGRAKDLSAPLYSILRTLYGKPNNNKIMNQNNKLKVKNLQTKPDVLKTL